MPTGTNGLRLTDGQLGWRQGIFSDVPRTKVVRYDTESARTGATPPLIDGVPEGGLAWAVNCSVRGGAIGQRFTMQPVVQGQNASIPWTITFPWATSVTSPTVAVYKKGTTSDVSGTVMPSGSHTVSGNSLTMKNLTSLTAGESYIVDIRITVDGIADEFFLEVKALRQELGLV